METIQVVLEAALLKATDRAARRLKMNRSAFIRQAVAEHLRALRARELEEADRRGYERVPETTDEMAAWDGAAAWPEDYSGERSGSSASRRQTSSARS